MKPLYSTQYIRDCRNKIDDDMNSYTDLFESVQKNNKIIDEFEFVFFGNLLLNLHFMFIDRDYSQNIVSCEVATITNSILSNFGVMKTDKEVKYDSENSVLEIKEGDIIKLDLVAFDTISTEFFDMLEGRPAPIVC